MTVPEVQSNQTNPVVQEQLLKTTSETATLNGREVSFFDTKNGCAAMSAGLLTIGFIALAILSHGTLPLVFALLSAISAIGTGVLTHRTIQEMQNLPTDEKTVVQVQPVIAPEMPSVAAVVLEEKTLEVVASEVALETEIVSSSVVLEEASATEELANQEPTRFEPTPKEPALKGISPTAQKVIGAASALAIGGFIVNKLFFPSVDSGVSLNQGTFVPLNWVPSLNVSNLR